MMITAADLNAYRAALRELAADAAGYVSGRLTHTGGMQTWKTKDVAIAAITDSIGSHGMQAQAYAGAFFDEVCAAEGIDAASELYEDAIDLDMLETEIYFFARKLVEGDRTGFTRDCSNLADYYVMRSAYENTVRNCAANNLRYARIPTGPDTCDWCLMLASRGFVYYTEHDALAGNHRNCFVGDTRVCGPELLGATRRLYKGTLVHLVTASGNEITVTPNHPILTSRGWVAADEIDNGDYLVCANLRQGDTSVVPDEHDVPPRIEDVFSSLSLTNTSRLDAVKVAAQDFHGDGIGSSEVDIVWTDRLLANGMQATVSQPSFHELFSIAHLNLTKGSLFGNCVGVGTSALDGFLAPSNGVMSGASLGGSFLGSHAGSTGDSCGTIAATRDSGLFEPSNRSCSGDSVALGERIKTLASYVASYEVIRHCHLVGVGRIGLRDIDASSFEMLAKGVSVASELSCDGADRLPAGIAFSRVIDKSISVDTCHVYNLTTSSNWYFANNIIAHNCDCIVCPGRGGDTFNDATQVEGYDPDEYYQLWRKSGFMPPKNNPQRKDGSYVRKVYNHDGATQRRDSRRLRKMQSELRNLNAHEREAIFERLNAASSREALDEAFKDVIGEFIKRGDTLKDQDWEDVGNHYHYLLEEIEKKKKRKG